MALNFKTFYVFTMFCVTTSHIVQAKTACKFWVNLFSCLHKNEQQFLILLYVILKFKQSMLTTKPQTSTLQVYRDSVLSVLLYERYLIN
jgi:hypothetical protein